MAHLLLTNARVVTPAGTLPGGWVALDAGRIGDVGAGPAPAAAEVVDLGGGWLLPGFVDLHMHGGGGADVTTDRASMRAAVEFHRGHGTTCTLVSLVAGPVDAMCAQLGWAAELTGRGQIAGAHLEGPFLAAARCGAQRPEHLRDPDAATLRRLLDAAGGCVRTLTVAPELPGALDLIVTAAAERVVVALGHTDATYEQARAGFAAGATLTTHLFNAMRPATPRSPGPALAALDADAFVELINDGVHLHDAVTRLVARARPRETVLITDAISAAGAGDGTFSLGEQTVVVAGGTARLAGGPLAGTAAITLAGSTLTMDAALRRAVGVLGLPIEAASAAASANPARVLGIADRTGAIAPGLDADLVVLDDELRVRRVMRGGAWVDTGPAAG